MNSSTRKIRINTKTIYIRFVMTYIQHTAQYLWELLQWHKWATGWRCSPAVWLHTAQQWSCSKTTTQLLLISTCSSAYCTRYTLLSSLVFVSSSYQSIQCPRRTGTGRNVSDFICCNLKVTPPHVFSHLIDLFPYCMFKRWKVETRSCHWVLGDVKICD